MAGKKAKGEKKIYLVYDFEELCGVFSSLPLARQAAEEHLGLVMDYTKRKAEKLGFGEVEFEVYRDEAERRWIYALVAKTKRDGADLHRRKVAIYQYNMDRYCSMLKRFVEKNAPASGEGQGGGGRQPE